MVHISSSRAWPVGVSLLAALLGGSIAGAIAKFLDESGIPGAGMIGTYFGVWIVLYQFGLNIVHYSGIVPILSLS